MPKRDMLINNVPGEECRIAIVEDGKLEELYHERTSVESHVGSIYKGKVVNVEPAIQAAFIDFGLERNGFLHVTDLHPRYFPGQHKEETERVGHKTPHRERPPIQRCLKRGQEILVQVIKEGIGTKGPTVTSYLSIPGRFLVMMPAMERLGVSRKVDDDDARREMRKILDELNPPEEFGFIIRTAGIGRPKSDLKRDLAYLVRLWKNLEKRMAQPGIGELYTESDLMIRTIRDVYSTDIDRIIVDEPTAAKRASDFLAIASPRAKSNVLRYDDPVPLFHRYGVEAQIETIHARPVPLPGGGSLVIDSTEALVAIDVNSGKMRNSGDAETTAYRTNVEACDEVCRQLRLRDLGGVVVIDLIDMRSPAKRRAIEARFRENLKRDRARTKPLAISQFGILEMTRQRMRPSLNKSVYSDCHYCHGEGTIKNVDAVVLDVMRRLSLVVCRKEVARLAVTVSPDVAFPLLNRKRAELVHLEHKFNVPIQVRVNPSGSVDFIELLPMDERGNPLTIDAMKNLTPPVLQPVESGLAPLEGDFSDIDEEETEEMERRATVMEQIDERRDPSDEGDRAPAALVALAGESGESDEEVRETVEASEGQAASAQEGLAGVSEGQEGQGEGGRRRRRRRRGRRGRSGDGQEQGGPEGGQGQRQPQQGGQPPRQPQHGGHGQRQPQQQQPKHRDQQPVSRGYSTGRVDDRRTGSAEGQVKGPAEGQAPEVAAPGGGGQPQQPGQPQLGPDGQPLRRRRRRGGRRHRRRREAQLRAQQTGEPGAAPTNGDGQTPFGGENLGSLTDAELDRIDPFNRADAAEDQFAEAEADDDIGNRREPGVDEGGEEADARYDERDERDDHDDREEREERETRDDREDVEPQPEDEPAPVAVMDESVEAGSSPQGEAEASAEEKQKPRRRRGGGRRKKSAGPATSEGGAEAGANEPSGEAPAKKKTTRRRPRRKPPGGKG